MAQARMGDTAKPHLEELANELLRQGEFASGLMRSALGKARGLALRLSLVLEYLWWYGGDDGMAAPPREISVSAFTSAARLVPYHFILMAERVYAAAAAPKADRDAATLARWIARGRPGEVHVRHLQREVRLPGLRDAESIHGAAGVLVEAGWLTPPPKGNGMGRPRANYTVNPRLLEQLPRVAGPAANLDLSLPAARCISRAVIFEPFSSLPRRPGAVGIHA